MGQRALLPRPGPTDAPIPDIKMGNLVGMALSPFALVLRLSYANPIIAIAASAVLAGIAYATGHVHWMGFLLCYAAFVMIVWDEQSNPPALAPVAPEEA